jgi:Na+:H+ antiporter
MAAGLAPQALGSISISSPSGPAWQFLVLFLVVIVGPPLVQRARVPGIIGLLVGGFAIGSHGLDLIGQGNTVVPDLGQLGLLYLMFVAGVELDLALIRVHRRAVALFGLLTFSVPMLLGVAVGLGLGWSTPAAVLLGALLASHTLLLYPMVRGAGLAADPAVATAVGATVLTDTASLVILAAVSGSELEGGSPASIALQVGVGLAVLIGFSLLVLPRLVRLGFRYLGTDRTVRYLLAVAAFLAAAALAESFGIEGLVGAFFAGLALNRLVPNEGTLMERIDFFGTAVFVPIFLVSVGLLLDPAVMVQGETLKLAGLFIAACVGGKAIAAWVAKRAMHLTSGQGEMVRSLTTPQAATALASTIVGFNIGLFGQSVVNAVLVLILVSIVIATIGIERAKRRVPVPEEETERLGARVLVALEDPGQARTALEVAARIAAADSGVTRGALWCSAAEARASGRLLEQLGEAGLAMGIDTEPRLLVHSSFAEGVVNAAAAERASCVLVGRASADGALPLRDAGDAIAAATPAVVAVLIGEAPRIEEVRLLRSDPAMDDAGRPAAAIVAAELATRIGGGEAQAQAPHGSDWIAELAPGQLCVVPTTLWELLPHGASPPPGAAVLIALEPSVPVAGAREPSGEAIGAGP